MPEIDRTAGQHEAFLIPSTTALPFAPMHRREANDDIDARRWCQGFYAAMQFRISTRAPLLDVNNVNHGLLLAILPHCSDDQGPSLLGLPRSGRETEDFLRNPTSICRRPSGPCANTGCRSATHAPADYCRCASSC